jgi:hypothetical protein
MLFTFVILTLKIQLRKHDEVAERKIACYGVDKRQRQTTAHRVLGGGLISGRTVD